MLMPTRCDLCFKTLTMDSEEDYRLTTITIEYGAQTRCTCCGKFKDKHTRIFSFCDINCLLTFVSENKGKLKKQDYDRLGYTAFKQREYVTNLRKSVGLKPI